MAGLGPFTGSALKAPGRLVRKATAAPLKGAGPTLQSAVAKGAGPALQDQQAPAGAPAPGVAAPWQPLVDAQVMGIYANRDQGLAGLDQAEKFLKLDYGLIQNADGSFAADVNNPQGKAALLQHTYQNAKRGDLNSSAAQGQMYSGSYANQVGERNRLEQLDFSTLTKNYGQSLGEIGSQRGQLQSQAAADAASAQLQGAMSYAGDSQNTPVPVAAAPAAAAGPKSGYQFMQSDGPRAALSYNLQKRADGKWVRVYENGDRILRP